MSKVKLLPCSFGAGIIEQGLFDGTVCKVRITSSGRSYIVEMDTDHALFLLAELNNRAQATINSKALDKVKNLVNAAVDFAELDGEITSEIGLGLKEAVRLLQTVSQPSKESHD